MCSVYLNGDVFLYGYLRYTILEIQVNDVLMNILCICAEIFSSLAYIIQYRYVWVGHTAANYCMNVHAIIA